MSIQPVLPIAVLLLVFAALATITLYAVGTSYTDKKEKIFTTIRLVLIYVLAFVIGLRPVIKDDKYEFMAKNLDVLFVVDTTISMWAEDYDNYKPRMMGVKENADYIAKEFAGSSFALVTFDDQAHVISPYTQDLVYIENLLDTMVAPDVEYAMGSDMSLPYADMESLLRSSSKKENRKTVVIFISDGEITNGNELNSYAELKQYVDSGMVLGYGTESGGKMNDGHHRNIVDPTTGKDALSVIDEKNLKSIADDLGVTYLHMTGKGDDNAAIDGALEYIKAASMSVTDSIDGVEKYKDIYYIFAGILAALLLAEACILVRRGRL